jgi:protein-tyrosine-phosphatase
MKFDFRGKMNPNRTVVFICEHGAAKSIVAATYFNRFANEKGLGLRAVARGTNPDDKLSAQAVQGLAEDGLTPTESVPQKLTAADVQSAQQVVVFGELPAEYRQDILFERWDDIPSISGSYEQARDAIVKRIRRMLDR